MVGPVTSLPTTMRPQRRIIEVARRGIDDRGAVSVSEVAQRLGVTRQTVYRYFPTHEALLAATALSAVDAFLDRLAEKRLGRSKIRPTR